MGFKMRGWSPFKQPKEEKMSTKDEIKISDTNPTWEGTDEYRNPADIPAHEYIHRGLNPSDYIPGYTTGKEAKEKRKGKKIPLIPRKKTKKSSDLFN